MTNSNWKEEVKEKNPWKEIADSYDENDAECLYGENNYYVCEGDKDAVKKFNSKAKGTPDEIITIVPPEPWWGNPLEAKLIILSLNPGYVEEVNEKLAKLLQSNDEIRKQVINYKKKTLLLDAESFLPEDEDNEGNPISCKDAVNMLGDWYWYKKIKQLKEDVNIDEKDFFKQIALIEYHGYSSKESSRRFPLKGDSFKSMDFTKELVLKIIKNKPDVIFLIMRSSKKWENLLDIEINGNKRFIYKDNKGMSQRISPQNLGDENYNKLIELLNK